MNRKVALVFIFFLIVVVSIIFFQSMLPPSLSRSESRLIKEFIMPMWDNSGIPIKLNMKLVRKLFGHFLEYFILGSGIFVFNVFRADHVDIDIFSELHILTVTTPRAITVCFIDESIQFISGRQPNIFDMWVDMSGFLFGFGVTVVIYTILKLIATVTLYTKDSVCTLLGLG